MGKGSGRRRGENADRIAENWVPNAHQKAVGRCPKCGRYPTWFNDIPLTAYCYGPENRPHPVMERVVPGAAQPYGPGKRTRWKKGRE